MAIAAEVISRTSATDSSSKVISLTREPLFHLGQGQSLDLQDLLSRFIPNRDLDGASLKLQYVGDERAELIVGPAVECGRVNFDLERLAEPADHLVPRGVRNRLDPEATGRRRGG